MIRTAQSSLVARRFSARITIDMTALSLTLPPPQKATSGSSTIRSGSRVWRRVSRWATPFSSNRELRLFQCAEAKPSARASHPLHPQENARGPAPRYRAQTERPDASLHLYSAVFSVEIERSQFLSQIFSPNSACPAATETDIPIASDDLPTPPGAARRVISPRIRSTP